MKQDLQRPWSLVRVIHENLRDHVDRVRRGSRSEDLVPGVRLDLREFEFGVVRVHAVDLLACGRPQHLDDFNQLVNSRFAREQRLP